jgi:hypothetical protein
MNLFNLNVFNLNEFICQKIFNFTVLETNVFNITLLFLGIGLDTTEIGSYKVSDGMA